MQFAKRIFLFLLVNILVVSTITLILSFIGGSQYDSGNQLDYVALAKFCLVYGMVGSLISLAISRMMAKWMMGVVVIPPNSGGPQEQWLVNTVYDISKRAGLPKMPEVGVYNSPEVNAFATGPTKSRALVAVSSGLLESMNKQEIEGVLAHEISHIQNGDMVTLTLIQGVVNAFVMFLSRVLAFFVSQLVKGDNQRMVRFALTFVFQLVFGFLGLLVISWFSRAREFRADSGSAKLCGKDSMLAALNALGRVQGIKTNGPASISPFKIAEDQTSLFSTHPSLASRINNLQTSV